MEGNGDILTPGNVPTSPGGNEEGEYKVNPETTVLWYKEWTSIFTAESGEVKILNVEPDAEVFKLNDLFSTL